ncbi:MAG: Pullulanase secretion protein pulG [Mitsuokella multacida]|jgi:type II secretory pathway pseudopilin PulG
MRTKEMRTNEAGFTLIGMLIAVGIVAILAMIAVPKFTSAIASANTAKIQSDLSTLDTAIAVYTIENGKAPEKVEDLKDYLQDEKVKPPTGKCYLNGKEEDIPNTSYTIENNRAVCGAGNTVTKFSKTAKVSDSGEQDQDSGSGGTSTGEKG